MVTHSSLLTMIVNERCIDYHIRFYITVRVLYTQYNLMYAKINMDDEDMGILLLAIYASEKLRQKKKRRNRTIWVKPYLAKRETNSTYLLLNDLRLRDINEYRCFLRMDTGTFIVSFFNCCSLNFRIM